MAATAGGRVHPRTRAGGGARKIRVPHQRDEVDCGRGRSEQSERSSSCGWRPDGPEPWPGDKKRGWLSVSRLFSQPPILRRKKLFVFQFPAFVFTYQEIEKTGVYVCQEMIYRQQRVEQFH